MADVGPRLREALVPVGMLLGVSADDLVFVDNATTGVNAVMRSLDLAPGDRILTTSWAYGAVAKTLAWVARRTGAVVDVAHLPFPVGPEGLDWSDLRRRLRGARILVVDHIASKPAVVFPIEAIVAAARAERQRKRATFGGFEIFCDESRMIGGDDSAPPPLAFFAAALAF